MELVCKDWVPPRNAGQRLEGRPHDVVLRLLGGEGGAAGLGVEAQHHGAGVLRFKAIAGEAGPQPAGGAELGHLLQKVGVGSEEEGETGRDLVELESRVQSSLRVGDGVGQGESDLLDCGAAGLPHMVAADANGVPLRDVLLAPAEYIGNQTHGTLGREYVGAAGDVLLQDVVLGGATDLAEVGPLLLGHGHVEGQEDSRGGVDGHGGGDLLQGDLLEEDLHIGQGGDGDAHLAYLALSDGIIGVVANLGRQVEGHGEAGLALLQEVAVAAVGLLGVAEAGILAHGPEPTAVHGGLDSAGKGELTREAKLIQVFPAGKIIGGVGRLDDLSVGRLEGVVALGKALGGAAVGAVQPLLLFAAVGFRQWNRLLNFRAREGIIVPGDRGTSVSPQM